MPSSSQRALVPFEVAAVVAAIIVSMPIPKVVPLLVIASISLFLRGRSWVERFKGPAVFAAIGLGAGAVGLAASIAVGAPIIETVSGHAVNWSMYPIVRGSGQTFVMLAIVVGISALAAEMVLRGWLVERVLELAPRHATILAILAGAIAEALLADGGLDARLGAGVFGLGLGAMYVYGGRSLVAPIAARLAFTLGALALEALQVIG
jgi:hypothetical protein